MQVVGTSVLEEGILSVAHRSVRPSVFDWAQRVLKRHVRRDPSLVVEIGPRDNKKMLAAMDADGLSQEVKDRILSEWRSSKTRVYVPDPRAMLRFFQRATDTMDWIESLPDNDRRIRRIERMSWKDADDASVEWHKALGRAKVESNDRLNGVVRVTEFENGSFIGRLVSKNALTAEGKMMGHCVGGYWHAVSEGRTQIYTLRDANGFPHVTIELNPTPAITLDDGTTVRLARAPAVGVNRLPLTDSNWVAVQVRGKQNQRPIEKYLTQVTQWLSDNDIPWVEYGQALPDARYDQIVTVYHIGSGDHSRLSGRTFSDPSKANDYGTKRVSDLLEGKASKSSENLKNINFINAYRWTGLDSLHREVGDPELVRKFVDEVSPTVVSVFENLVKTMSFSEAATRSGVAILSGLISRHGLEAGDVNTAMFNAIIVKGDAEAVYLKDTLISGQGFGKPIEAVIHKLPLAPLALLANGYAQGKEADVMDMITPHLAQSVEMMAEYPNCVHVVQSNYSGVTADNIRQAYLYCGLASEYGEARSNVIRSVKGQISQLRVAVRKATSPDRSTSEKINLMRNMLNDGYEARLNGAAISKFGKDSHLVAFEDVRPQVKQRLSADPAVRPTRYPAMRL